MKVLLKARNVTNGDYGKDPYLVLDMSVPIKGYDNAIKVLGAFEDFTSIEVRLTEEHIVAVKLSEEQEGREEISELDYDDHLILNETEVFEEDEEYIGSPYRLSISQWGSNISIYNYDDNYEVEYPTVNQQP